MPLRNCSPPTPKNLGCSCTSFSPTLVCIQSLHEQFFGIYQFTSLIRYPFALHCSGEPPNLQECGFFVRGGGKFSLCKHNSACAPLGYIHLCTVPSKTDHCGGVCCLLMHCSESHFSSSPKSFVSELLYLKQKEDTLQGEAEGQHAKHTCCQVNVYCEFYSCIQLGALC